MEGKLCAEFNEISRGDVALAGGKGANLGDMFQAELAIPPGFVICAPAYRRMLEKSGLEDQLNKIIASFDQNGDARLQQIETQARHLIETMPIDEQLQQTITRCYRRLGDNVAVAVRSSATAEDLPDASFAGQQDTYLNISGEKAVLDAFRRCCASLFTSRAVFYRCQKGFDCTALSMAVVVQKMIYPEKSGVMFTVDPVLKDRSQAVIEAVWGLGEAIVSGMVTPDHYKVDRKTYAMVYKFIPEKSKMVVQSNHGGVVTTDVPPEKISARILTTEELRKLTELGDKIEQHFNCPQDVEWGIENGRIFLLQSRPITNL